MVVAYRGTSPTVPVANIASGLETVSRAAHTTPAVNVGSAQALVVSYWMHEDSTTTALTPPADVVVRATGTQTGSGRVTTLFADSGTPPGAGQYAGRTATAASPNINATMWAVVLAPA
jgi:hypothetical protein